jgi:hypothetical protein
MEKFSVYDFLGLMLPGTLFVYFCDLINSAYSVVPYSLVSGSWDLKVGIILCLALICGAILFALNFWLVEHALWYNRIFRMYDHVFDIYLDMPSLHSFMNPVFNRKAQSWFGQEIFFIRDELDPMDGKDRQQKKEYQDQFYDRAYYELEYQNKIDQAKTVQSFYFFFRQVVTACLILLGLIVSLQIIYSVFNMNCRGTNSECKIQIVAFLVVITFISVILAHWYRKRMVQKIYWAYFTHLNQISKT